MVEVDDHTVVEDEIIGLLEKLPHKLQVEFALYCAKDVFHLVEDKDKPSISNILNTIEKWLKDEATAKEVTTAAYAAYAANAYAAYSPNAIAAAYITASTAYVANAAYITASAKALHTRNTAAIYVGKLEEYLAYLIKMIESLPLVEKTIYNLRSSS